VIALLFKIYKVVFKQERSGVRNSSKYSRLLITIIIFLRPINKQTDIYSDEAFAGKELKNTCSWMTTENGRRRFMKMNSVINC
jgi:hypothetical protein